MTRRVVRAPCHALRVVSCLALLGLIAAEGNVRAAEARPGARVAACSKKVQRHPTHYLPRVQLGEVLLERARLTHDPDSIARARESLRHSLELQPSFRAYRALSALSNFAHRFEDALDWLELAAAAAPYDTSLLAQRVEALLGLGRVDDVASLLEDAPRGDFYAAASFGRWHAESGRVDEAVEAFAAAVELAHEAQATELEVWARVAAGAVRLDSGEPEAAAPHLERAAALDSGSILVRIHLAELLEARGRSAAALRKYRDLARATGNPELHSRAFVLAQRLGRSQLARRHFERAERGFERVVEAGEIYSLGPLATLYAAAGREREARAALNRLELLGEP